MKRFYKAVSVHQVAGGWQVTLDGRPVKTVKGAQQIVPTETLARMLAAEWDSQGEKIDPASFVFRDMADYAIDIVAPDRAAAADNLVAYGDTDTLLYRADPDEPLYARQQEVWEPIVAAFEAREEVQLTRVSGIMHKPQAPQAIARLKDRFGAMDGFALAANEAMTSLAASLITALTAAGTDSEQNVHALWAAASLEEEWQADLWGRDEEAEERRAKRAGDFLNAWKFVQSAKS